MALGIPNRLIILGVILGALFIPDRISRAGAISTGIAQNIQTSLSALGSPQITPTFNPTIGLSGNIGTGVVGTFSRIGSVILPDDPSGDPVTDPVDDPVIDPLEYEKQNPSSPFYETG